MAETKNGASVVIIGGGVTGLSTAWWLARGGIDVLVLEKGIIGWEASGRNGGGCTHPQSPLFPEEQRLWPQMDELLGYPTEHQKHRLKIVLHESDVEFMLGWVRMGEKQGFHYDTLDGKQIRELAPLAGDTVERGYLLKYGGHANPQRTSQAYAWALQDLGGRILQHCTVTGFDTAGGKVTRVRTDRGDFGCDHVLIAAGPQTGLLAEMLGVDLPVASGRAEMIVTEPLPAMPMSGVDGNGLYGRQTLRGNLVYGGGPHEWLPPVDLKTPPKPSSPLLRNIGRRLMELFPKAAHVRMIRSWSGVIENTPDGRAVIDWMPGFDNAIVATMSSVGFGLSPASGHAIRDLIVDGACSFADLSTMRLDRFAGLPEDWREAQGWLPPVAA
ncbi:FAD-binding oxidoreductase [Mycobacterium sp. KBS0706]|uniref:NAD(P)/FAD-dependent oxidoreductase n=1 Tax=Mycobacterium sp. KBS0706 TaxID=2578109 RepID=UPI00110F9FBD|nr:FAD-binding oxidoreductase [Mycobacterium sp. KBS0706]TSD84912.1 FAD-binding oxidoreductase [Mycobacterium sp. KBS0706]